MIPIRGEYQAPVIELSQVLIPSRSPLAAPTAATMANMISTMIRTHQ